MKTAERDALLMLLAVTSGSADGWSYSSLGHAFVANMTGNTVLVGLSVVQGNRDFVHPLISLACYAAGVVAGALLTRGVKEGAIWPRTIGRALMVEWLLMSAAAAGWALTRHAAARASPGPGLLLGAVAFAIGLQSGAMLRLKIPGVVTTYITGTWTMLLYGLTNLASGERQQDTSRKTQFEKRLGLQSVFLAVYFLAAVLTGWLLRNAPAAVGLAPAASVLLVALYGLRRGEAR